ncbi:MAG: hypothetical protein V7L04_05910 [Nostoc sp.]|uniref:hypothetical protein n=1 Tax=Nostoc sp. TaxID=1180 RepID=UPI002FF7238D
MLKITADYFSNILLDIAPPQSLIIPPLNSKIVPLNTSCRVKKALAQPAAGIA